MFKAAGPWIRAESEEVPEGLFKQNSDSNSDDQQELSSPTNIMSYPMADKGVEIVIYCHIVPTNNASYRDCPTPP
nr:hypothetical protein CFP56_51508 [Quercus suber]